MSLPEENEVVVETSESDSEPASLSVTDKRPQLRRGAHDATTRAVKTARSTRREQDKSIFGSEDEDDEEDDKENTGGRRGRDDDKSEEDDEDDESSVEISSNQKAGADADGDQGDDDSEDSYQPIQVNFDPKSGQAYLFKYSNESGCDERVMAIHCSRNCYPFPAIEFSADDIRGMTESAAKGKVGVPCPGCPVHYFNDTKVMAFKLSATTQARSSDHGRKVPVVACDLHKMHSIWKGMFYH